MGLGNEVPMGEIPGWPLTMWGGVASVLDTSGSPCEYEGILKTPAGLMYLLEELHIAQCGKERK